MSMEGALKLKEISYIHCEAYAAGELKHGTISLVENGVLVIGVATQQELFEKAYELDGSPVLIYDPGTQYMGRYYYQIYVNQQPLGWLENLNPADFVSMTYQLNNDEVKYLVVLKDSEMYQQNREYFDSKEILFENEAGMLVTYTGTGWMPGEE